MYIVTQWILSCPSFHCSLPKPSLPIGHWISWHLPSFPAGCCHGPMVHMVHDPLCPRNHSLSLGIRAKVISIAQGRNSLPVSSTRALCPLPLQIHSQCPTMVKPSTLLFWSEVRVSVDTDHRSVYHSKTALNPSVPLFRASKPVNQASQPCGLSSSW